MTGGNEENTRAIVNAQVEQAQKALDALEKKKPTKKKPSLKGSPMDMLKAQQKVEEEYKAAMDKHNADVAAAKGTLDAWTGIASLMDGHAKNPLDSEADKGGNPPATADENAVAEKAGAEAKAEGAKAEGAESGGRNEERKGVGGVQEETQNVVGAKAMSHDEAIAFIADMENRAKVAPSVDLTIENWDALFGSDGIVNTPIGDVKMGDNQFTKMLRDDRSNKLGMVKPTLETPDVILEDASKAKEGDKEEIPYSYIFIKAFKKADGSRYYYFASVTVSKDGREVVISNQEKRKNAIANLLSKDKLVWKHADDVSDASDVAQGLYSSQGNVSDLTTEGTDAPQTNVISDDKGNEFPADLQESEKESDAEAQKKAREAAAERLDVEIDKQFDIRGRDKIDYWAVSYNSGELTGDQLRRLEKVAESLGGSFDWDMDFFDMPSVEAAEKMKEAMIDEAAKERSDEKADESEQKQTEASNATANETEGKTDGKNTEENTSDKEPDSPASEPAKAAYTIEPATYTNKKGKTSDVSLLKFNGKLTPEQERAIREFAKERMGEGRFAPARGWKDRESGGWMFRVEEDAQKAAEMVGNDEAVANAQPLTADELREAVDSEQDKPKRTEKKPKPANRVESIPAKEEKPQYEVSDEEFDGLLNDIRDILGIGDDEGDAGFHFRDPDELTPEQRQKLMAVGLRAAMALVERGNESFSDYASMMIKALGNKVRPWLKAFYGGLEYIPGYDKYSLTPYDEVKAFDVENFDKPHNDVLAKASMMAEEGKAQTVANKATDELKAKRNERRKETDEQRAADTAAVAKKAGAAASEAETVAETQGNEQSVSESAERVDDALDEVDGQLSALGYFEGDGNDTASAEKEAVNKAAELAESLISDLGIDRYAATHEESLHGGINKKKPLAVADIGDKYGFITVRLPLAEGRTLVIEISAERVSADGSVNSNPSMRTSGLTVSVMKKSDSFGETCENRESILNDSSYEGGSITNRVGSFPYIVPSLLWLYHGLCG